MGFAGHPPPGTVGVAMLHLPSSIRTDIISHCLSGLPEEACGLIAGDPGASVVAASYATHNLAHSAKLYTVDPKDHLKADIQAEAAGTQIIGVYHSHTHTDAYPSPTDVAQAPDPNWHYVLVSLRDTHPVLRSYWIIDGNIYEETVSSHDL
jgi:proteasome lid subunit RPN8/RPN11